MRMLRFQNPTFRKGRNVTVRKGDYWFGTKSVLIPDISGDMARKTYTRLMKFNELTDGMLRHEHDPNCRKVDGLYKEMKKLYPGFKRNSQITIISFWY